MEQFINSLAPALSDVPLAILVVAVVGVIVYRVLLYNSRANDQLYHLFERTIASNERLSEAITLLERANRDVAEREQERRLEVADRIINELRETEARIIIEVKKQGSKAQ